MTHNQIVREQFNKQAEKYASWSLGKNVKHLNGYFDFCKIDPTDRVLDVACGPGDFIINAAKRISAGRGIDISDREIMIANSRLKDFGLSNVTFDCGAVEVLPYSNDVFSIVICRYAFHHFDNPLQVLKEMIRCCETGGKIGLLDISSYKDDYVNQFFETFDRLVDISHYKTLSAAEFGQLYDSVSVQKTKEITIDVELNVREYIDQNYQSPEIKKKIDRHLLSGLHDNKLSRFLYMRDGQLYFKRHVYLMLGIKFEH